MVVEEAVARAVVAVELVVLAVLLQLLLVLVHLLGRGAGIVVAEEAQQRAGQVLGVIDGSHWVLGVEVGFSHDHAPAPALDGRVEPTALADCEEGVAPAGAGAEETHLAVDVGLGAEVFHGAGDVADHLVVGHTASSPHRSADVLRGSVAVAGVQVGGDGYVAMMGVAAGGLTVPLIPAGSVVNHHHGGEGTGAHWSG